MIASATRTRRAGQWVTAVALLAILIATLTPSRTLVPPAGPWCLLCGDVGVVDALQNVVLFAPLGVGLALLGVPLLPAVFLAGALSASIETLQYTLIAGRDGTLGDVVTNTAGAAVGVALVLWRVNPLAPTPVVARWLRAVAIVAWLLVAAVTSVGFGPSTPRGPYALFGSLLDTVGGSPPPFRLLQASVDTLLIPLAAADPRPALQQALSSRSSSFSVDLLITGTTSGVRRGIRLASLRGIVFSLQQVGTRFVCSRRLASAALLLRTPSIAVPVFPDAGGRDPAGQSRVRVTCARDGARLTISSISARDSVESTAALTPGAGWVLFLPARLPTGRFALAAANVAWLAILALAASYLVLLPTIGNAAGAAGALRAGAPVLVPFLALVTLMQTLLPRLMGGASSPWWELAATAAGLAAGALLAGRLARPTAPGAG